MRQHYRKEFGLYLKELRKEANLSQEDLAEKLDVSRITIVKTEKGQNIPKADFIERAYQLFQDAELVIKYIKTQPDNKVLNTLANKIAVFNAEIAVRVANHVIKNSIRTLELQPAAITLFQTIIWEMAEGKSNKRKIECMLRLLKQMDPEPNVFLKLLNELYDISRVTKKYDVFITIVESVERRLNLNNQKLSLILFKKANAYYFKGEHFKAYNTSSKAIEVMGDAIYEHTVLLYNRHSLICMQLFNYEEALRFTQAILKLVPVGSEQHNLELASLARQHYMLEQYLEAERIWNQLLSSMKKNDVKRIHSLNDFIMMHIKKGEINKAKVKIRECELLLKNAEKIGWPFHSIESMLLRRNKAVLEAVVHNDFFTESISYVLDELQNSYLKDELQLTKNFILERSFLSGKIESIPKKEAYNP